MPPTESAADVLIVGGGVTGMACALHLAANGARPLVVDWGGNAGSNANAGSLHVQLQSRFLRLYPHLAPNVEASLSLYVSAVDEWGELDARHGPFQLVRGGGLMVAETDAQLKFLAEKAERERRHGVTAEILHRRDLDAIAPWIGPHIVGAELCGNEGKVNPLLANRALKAAATAAGARFVEDRVIALERTGNGVTAVGAKGTTRYSAGQVVIAAAWGSGGLAQSLGITAPTESEPLHMNITEAAAYDIRHLVQHAERPITLKQFESGQVVIGGGWPADKGAGDDAPSVRADSLLGNVALAARLAPAIAHLRVIRTWAGFNTTHDGKTILGRKGPIILAVPGDAGYTLGPLVGRAAAALALDATPPFDLTPYSPARFAA
ncbi:MAG: FAD-dependent oxidoreductase [Pseudomonadota bacterium]